MKKLICMEFAIMAMLLISSCGKNDEEVKGTPNVKETNYSLYSGESKEVIGTNLDNLTWEGDVFVANINERSVIHANKVGFSTFFSSDIKEGSSLIRVAVEPKITSFSEPLFFWNGVGTRIVYEDGYIKVKPMQYAHMPEADIWGIKSAFIKLYVEECGLPWTVYSQTNDAMIFKTDKDASPYVIYMFDKDKGVIGAGVYINPLKCDDLVEFLDERYLIYSVDKNNYTAEFAHAIDYCDEMNIDYLGYMSYSSQLGMIIIAYAPDKNSSRSEINSILEYIQNVDL